MSKEYKCCMCKKEVNPPMTNIKLNRALWIRISPLLVVYVCHDCQTKYADASLFNSLPHITIGELKGGKK